MTLETTVEEFDEAQFVAGLATALDISPDLVAAVEVESGSIVALTTIKASSAPGAPTQDEVEATFLNTPLETLSEDVGFRVLSRSVVEPALPTGAVSADDARPADQRAGSASAADQTLQAAIAAAGSGGGGGLLILFIALGSAAFMTLSAVSAVKLRQRQLRYQQHVDQIEGQIILRRRTRFPTLGGRSARPGGAVRSGDVVESPLQMEMQGTGSDAAGSAQLVLVSPKSVHAPLVLEQVRPSDDAAGGVGEAVPVAPRSARSSPTGFGRLRPASSDGAQ